MADGWKRAIAATKATRAVKLTKAQRAALEYIRREGPGTLPDTKSGRVPAAVDQLVQAGLLETLNRLRPGPAMYEITPAGRAALGHL